MSETAMHIGGEQMRYSGYLMEMAFYGRQLTDPEVLAATSYLSMKYGVTPSFISSDGLVASDGSVVYAAGSEYTNDVVAIGRDDASTLDQRQSRPVSGMETISVYNGDHLTMLPASNEANTESISVDKAFLAMGHNGAGYRFVDHDSGTNQRSMRTWNIEATMGPTATAHTFEATFFFAQWSIPSDVTTAFISDDETFSTFTEVSLADLDDGRVFKHTFDAGAADASGVRKWVGYMALGRPHPNPPTPPTCNIDIYTAKLTKMLRINITEDTVLPVDPDWDIHEIGAHSDNEEVFVAPIRVALDAVTKQLYWTDNSQQKFYDAEGELTTASAFTQDGVPNPDFHNSRLEWPIMRTGQDFNFSKHEVEYVGRMSHTLPAPTTQLGSMVLDDHRNEIYWLETTGLYTMRMDGKYYKHLLKSHVVNGFQDLGIDFASCRAFIVSKDSTSGTHYHIGRVRLDGSQYENLVPRFGTVYSIAIDSDAGYMYWTEYQTAAESLLSGGPSKIRRLIMRATLDGLCVTEFLDVSDMNIDSVANLQPRNIELEPCMGYLYFHTDSSGTMFRAPYNVSSHGDNWGVVEKVVNAGLTEMQALTISTQSQKAAHLCQPDQYDLCLNPSYITGQLGKITQSTEAMSHTEIQKMAPDHNPASTWWNVMKMSDTVATPNRREERPFYNLKSSHNVDLVHMTDAAHTSYSSFRAYDMQFSEDESTLTWIEGRQTATTAADDTDPVTARIMQTTPNWYHNGSAVNIIDPRTGDENMTKIFGFEFANSITGSEHTAKSIAPASIQWDASKDCVTHPYEFCKEPTLVLGGKQFMRVSNHDGADGPVYNPSNQNTDTAPTDYKWKLRMGSDSEVSGMNYAKDMMVLDDPGSYIRALAVNEKQDRVFWAENLDVAGNADSYLYSAPWNGTHVVREEKVMVTTIDGTKTGWGHYVNSLAVDDEARCAKFDPYSSKCLNADLWWLGGTTSNYGYIAKGEVAPMEEPTNDANVTMGGWTCPSGVTDCQGQIKTTADHPNFGMGSSRLLYDQPIRGADMTQTGDLYISTGQRKGIFIVNETDGVFGRTKIRDTAGHVFGVATDTSGFCTFDPYADIPNPPMLFVGTNTEFMGEMCHNGGELTPIKTCENYQKGFTGFNDAGTAINPADCATTDPMDDAKILSVQIEDEGKGDKMYWAQTTAGAAIPTTKNYRMRIMEGNATNKGPGGAAGQIPIGGHLVPEQDQSNDCTLQSFVFDKDNQCYNDPYANAKTPTIFFGGRGSFMKTDHRGAEFERFLPTSSTATAAHGKERTILSMAANHDQSKLYFTEKTRSSDGDGYRHYIKSVNMTSIPYHPRSFDDDFTSDIPEVVDEVVANIQIYPANAAGEIIANLSCDGDCFMTTTAAVGGRKDAPILYTTPPSRNDTEALRNLCVRCDCHDYDAADTGRPECETEIDGTTYHGIPPTFGQKCTNTNSETTCDIAEAHWEARVLVKLGCSDTGCNDTAAKSQAGITVYDEDGYRPPLGIYVASDTAGGRFSLCFSAIGSCSKWYDSERHPDWIGLKLEREASQSADSFQYAGYYSLNAAFTQPPFTIWKRFGIQQRDGGNGPINMAAATGEHKRIGLYFTGKTMGSALFKNFEVRSVDERQEDVVLPLADDKILNGKFKTKSGVEQLIPNRDSNAGGGYWEPTGLVLDDTAQCTSDLYEAHLYPNVMSAGYQVITQQDAAEQGPAQKVFGLIMDRADGAQDAAKTMRDTQIQDMAKSDNGTDLYWIQKQGSKTKIKKGRIDQMDCALSVPLADRHASSSRSEWYYKPSMSKLYASQYAWAPLANSDSEWLQLDIVSCRHVTHKLARSASSEESPAWNGQNNAQRSIINGQYAWCGAASDYNGDGGWLQLHLANCMKTIPTDKRKTSSSYTYYYGVTTSQINLNYGRDHAKTTYGWISGHSLEEQQNAWIQLDVGVWSGVTSVVPGVVHGLKIQGNANSYYTKSYHVRYSMDEKSWSDPVPPKTGSEFDSTLNPGDTNDYSGSIDANTVNDRDFNAPITARYVRVYPKEWYGYPSLRLDAYDCTDEMSKDPVPVAGVATQGHDTSAWWTITYNVHYSLDGTSWLPATSDSNSFDFDGNSDSSTIVHNQFNETVSARYVRISPKTWLTRPSLRVEAYECDYPTNKSAVPVYGLHTRGGPNYWVETYRVQYSVDKDVWIPLDRTSASDEFFANTDIATIAETPFTEPINAKYVRIYPKEWYASIQFRADAYGCPGVETLYTQTQDGWSIQVDDTGTCAADPYWDYTMNVAIDAPQLFIGSSYWGSGTGNDQTGVFQTCHNGGALSEFFRASANGAGTVSTHDHLYRASIQGMQLDDKNGDMYWAQTDQATWEKTIRKRNLIPEIEELAQDRQNTEEVNGLGYMSTGEAPSFWRGYKRSASSEDSPVYSADGAKLGGDFQDIYGWLSHSDDVTTPWYEMDAGFSRETPGSFPHCVILLELL
jgi:hypothetical protein